MGGAVDFDAAIAEAEGETTFEFRFLGETWDLPASPLAKDMAKVQRLYMLSAELAVKQEKGTIDNSDANKVIEAAGGSDLSNLLAMMIGREMLDAWMDRGMTFAQLRAVFRWLWRHYNGLDPEGDDEGEAPASNRAQRRATAKVTSKRSSKTGGSSKPTSSESTGSISAAS